MKSCTVVFAALLAACSDDSTQAMPDAGARADAPPSCPLPTAPLPSGMHQLFISFDGATITLGDCDDSRTSCSSLVTQSSTVVPPFLDGQGTRDARLTAISDMVQEALAPFSVDVVTTRPPSGSYWMISVGGTSDAITGAADVTTAMRPTCEPTNRNSIAFAFEQEEETTNRAYADAIASAFGRLAGLVAVTQSGDCMCMHSTCAHTRACTWGTGAVAVAGNACERTVQNEHQLLMDAVGCR